MQKIWNTTGQEGCDDCQWLANETEGEWLICDECEWVLHGEDDGQPDEAQEWHDFDPLCQEGIDMDKFRLFLEIIRTCVPIAILALQLLIMQGVTF